jgi:hypothetical protein
MKKCINCHTKLGLFSNKILVYKDDFFKDDFWNGYVCSDKCKKEILKRAEKEFEEDIPNIKKNSKEYVCNSCYYEWISKKSFGVPAICPKCKGKNIIKSSLTKEWEEDYRKHKGAIIQHILSNFRLDSQTNS